MKLSLILLPYYMVGKMCSILFEIGVNLNEVQPLRCGFAFDQIS